MNVAGLATALSCAKGDKRQFRKSIDAAYKACKPRNAVPTSAIQTSRAAHVPQVPLVGRLKARKHTKHRRVDMKQIKILGLALVAVFALASAVAATSAMALELPDIHVVLGEAAPVTGEGTTGKKQGAATLETEVGSKLSAEELKILLKLEALSALGPVDLHFVNVAEGKGPTKCNTEGDAEGVVLLPKAEYHIVAFKNAGGVLLQEVVILFPETTMKCNKLSVKLRQPVLAKLIVAGNTQVTSFGVDAKCAGKGKQELSTYFNDEGKELTKQLITSNFGLGFENGCEATAEEIKIKTNKMIEFLGL
jgi:hypothetical protein